MRSAKNNLREAEDSVFASPASTEVLLAAQNGDGDAFGRLVDPLQRELKAHCYRMLGSYADAEDALQETLLRAWRGLARFEGRSSFRSWVYRIATNACLRAIERRPKRVLPMDYAPAADPHVPRGPAYRALRCRLGAERYRRPRLDARPGRQDRDAAASDLVQRP